MTYTIKYMLCDKPNKTKPATVNAKSFKSERSFIRELITNIEAGKSIRPGILKNNGSSDKDWIAQELVFIDIDDGATIDESLAVCKEIGITPLFIYKSFSYTEDKQKHRIVFRLNKVETDYSAIKELIELMIIAFKADKKCSNAGRIYYGTNHKVEHVNINAAIDLTNVTLSLKEAQTPHGFIKTTDESCNDLFNSRIKDPQLKNLILIPKGISCGSFSHITNILHNTTFNSYSEVSKALKQLDLSVLLGGKNIKCILPEHGEDKSPSASVYKTDKGYYYYKCHACNTNALDIYGLTARIYNITGPNNYVFYKCTNILIDLFDIKLSNDKWKQEQDRIIKANKIILKSFNTKPENNMYLKKYPKAAKEFSKRIQLLRSLTDEALIALEVCPTKNKHGDLLFNTSLRYIANDINKDFSNVGKWIKFLCYLGFIKKIDYNSIKNTKMGKMIMDYGRQNNYSKLPQVYSIPEWTEDVFKQAEENYKLFKSNGGTIKGATARQFNALGAKEVVVQPNKETDTIKAIRVDILNYIRSRKKYCLVKELKTYGKSNGYSDRLISSFISEISKTEGIRYYRYTTKKIKEMYDLPESIHHSNAIFIVTK